MAALIAILGVKAVRALIIAAGIIAAWGVWSTTHDRKVERRAVANVEKASDNAAKKGKRAADRSATPWVRGTRDPTTRDD